MLDASNLDYMDGAGAGLVLRMRQIQAERGGTLEVSGLKPELAKLLEKFPPDRDFAEVEPEKPDPGIIAGIGLAAQKFLADLRDQIAFTGDCALAMTTALAKPATIRWKDVLTYCIKVGVNGLGIVMFIGFLMGLVMSFQAGATLERFGAQVFLANMIGVAMFRELGPLATAIFVAGRSGSAFAAEIGTMKVNEEVNALTTMGLDPVRFLVVPKMLAALIVMPILTMIFNFFSLIGGALVMLSMGFGLNTYVSRVFDSLSMSDFVGGSIKTVIFSLLVAAIGCQRGMATGSGPGAVGDSTTSAVVTGIVIIGIADGVFAVAMYLMGV